MPEKAAPRLPGACSTGNKCWGQVTGSPGALSRSRTLKVTASGLLPWFHGGVGNVAPFGHELEMDILSTTKSTPASYSAAAGTRLSGGTNRRPPGPDPCVGRVSAGSGRSIEAAARGGLRLAWDDVPPVTSVKGSIARGWEGQLVTRSTSLSRGSCLPEVRS
jgi:hypothetical protein